MAKNYVALVALSLIFTQKAASLESCCGDLGCFDSGFPFYQASVRPVNTVPDCAIMSSFKLHLNTRKNPVDTQVLDPFTPSSIITSNFNLSLGTKLLIHGFTDNYYWPWWKDMVAELLKEGDYNIIRADIEKASVSPFIQAIANSRLAGAYLAEFLNLLKDQFNHDPVKVHIIGHSLGVQVSSYVGERVNKVGRITGLDPGGLYFTNTDPAVRLDPADALMVDTIVTDGDRTILPIYALGSLQPMGHLNFYFNGGWQQPGCVAGYWNNLFGNPSAYNNSAYDMVGSVAQNAYQSVGCSHWRAFFLFLDSIDRSKCQMQAYRCDTYETFQDGECFTCANGGCSTFGYHYLVEYNTTKNFHMNTNDRIPFCSYNYKLNLKLQQKTSANDARTERGEIRVTFYGSQSSSDRITLTKKWELTNNLIPRTLGQINTIVLNWDASYSLINPWDWWVKHYIYLDGDLELIDESHLSTFFLPSRTQIEELKDVVIDRRN